MLQKTVPAAAATKLLILLALLAGFLCCTACKHSTPVEKSADLPTPDAANAQLTPDNQNIQAALREISADSLQAYVRTLAGFRTRHAVSDTASPDSGIGAARNWILRKFQSFSAAAGGRLQAGFDPFYATICNQDRLHKNIIAVLPGTLTPELRIMVSGHYDSRTLDRCDGSSFAPGANDDGSGTAAVLELARVLSQFEFASTLIFAAFTGEEQGLFGSRHYAAAARQRGDKIIAMATNDVVGNIVGGSGKIDSSHVRCFSDDPMTSPHRQLARYIKLQGEAYVPGFEVRLILARDRPGRGGDHFAFVEQDYTAARLTEPEDNLTRQHNPDDLPEFMSFSYLQKVTQVNAAYLASLAGAPPTPIAVRVEDLGDNRYRVSWVVANREQVAKFLVATRPMAAATYDSLYDGGVNDSVVLSNLRKPAFISVSAVSAAGDESRFSQEVLIQ